MLIRLLIAAAFSTLALSVFAEDSYTRSAQEPAAPSSASSNSDHYDPVALNELAVLKIRQGDLATGRILLERAALLAPYDERIRSNLRELKIHSGDLPSTGSEPAEAQPGMQIPGSPTEDPRIIPPAPPALWPPR